MMLMSLIEIRQKYARVKGNIMFCPEYKPQRDAYGLALPGLKKSLEEMEETQ